MKKRNYLQKHRDHQVDILPSTAHNLAKFWCRDCQVFVAWLSRQEAKTARQLGLIQLEPKNSHLYSFFDNLDK